MSKITTKMFQFVHQIYMFLNLVAEIFLISFLISIMNRNERADHQMYTWLQERIYSSRCLVPFSPTVNTAELVCLTFFAASVLLPISIFLLDNMVKLQSLMCAPLPTVAWNVIVSLKLFFTTHDHLQP